MKYLRKYDQDYWNPCDALLAAAFLYPDVIERENFFNIRLELFDKEKRGQIIEVSNIQESESTKVKIIEKLNVDKFKIIIVENLNN